MSITPTSKAVEAYPFIQFEITRVFVYGRTSEVVNTKVIITAIL